MTLLPRRKNASADCRKYNQQHFPMMTNHQISFTKVLISMREHILETAAGLFYREGLRSVGVDRIIADAGIAKATLYRHFATKEQLIVAYLKSRHDITLAAMSAAIHKAGTDPVQRVCALYDWLYTRANAEFRGCAFLLAVAEHGDAEAVREVVREHKDAVRLMFEAALEGVRKPVLQELPEQLALLYDGALATIMVRRRPDAARLARKSACLLMELYLAAPKKRAVRSAVA